MASRSAREKTGQLERSANTALQCTALHCNAAHSQPARKESASPARRSSNNLSAHSTDFFSSSTCTPVLSPFVCAQTPCYGVYRTADGFISVGSLEPKFWSSLCQSLGRADLIPQQFPDSPEGAAHVKEQLQQIFSKHNNEYWQRFFQDKDCCVEIGRKERRWRSERT